MTAVRLTKSVYIKNMDIVLIVLQLKNTVEKLEH
jgi:hypothetical protein